MYSIERIDNVLSQVGYRISKNQYELSLIGIRKTNERHRFCDTLILHMMIDNDVTYKEFSISTCPGIDELINPKTGNFIYIMQSGIYKDFWKLGYRSVSSYRCLSQNVPIYIKRVLDYNKKKFEVVTSNDLFPVYRNLDLSRHEYMLYARYGSDTARQIVEKPADLVHITRYAELQVKNTRKHYFNYILMEDDGNNLSVRIDT